MKKNASLCEREISPLIAAWHYFVHISCNFRLDNSGENANFKKERMLGFLRELTLRWIFSIIRVGEFSLDENTFQSKKQHLNAKFIQLLVKILFSVWHGMWILNRVHFKLPPLNQCQVRTFAKAIVNYKNGWTNLKKLSRLE